MLSFKEPVRILHLDDSALDAQLVELTLEMAEDQLPSTITHVQTRRQFENALEQCDQFDIILSDYRMPGFDGDEALKLARAKCPELPFIMVTGELGEDRAIETLKRGASDYVLKGNMLRLVPAIARALAEAENNRMRKQAEAALKREHQRVTEILESVGDAFYSLDREYCFTYANQHALTLWGKSAEEILGRSLWQVFPMMEGSESQRLLIDAMARRTTADFEVRSPVVNTWLDVRVYPAAEGGASVYFREITERKQMEEALRQSEERFRLIADTMPVLVWTATAEGTVDYGNRHSRDYSGIPPAVPGEPAWQTPVHPDDAGATEEAWQRSVRTGEHFQVEHRLMRADGVYRWHLSRAVPVRDARGEIIKWYGTATDVHEIREAHQELEWRVQKRTEQLAATNRELEAFTSTVSHDLRAPLRAIQGLHSMLAERTGGSLGAEERKMLDTISQNVARMDSLISALLRFSRLAQAPLTTAPVNMQAMAETVMREQQQALGCTGGVVHVHVHDLPVVAADPTLMRQVLANLFSNALKFTQKTAQPQIEVGAEAHGGEWLFFVRDNGVGFNSKHAGRLFQVFQRLHSEAEFEGTGIGLANVKRIIERHGGRVYAEGEEGRGASFYFTLPTLS